jgi:hypothetical protein
VVRPARVLPPDYAPDFLDNYELGFIEPLFDNRVAFNITSFMME